MAAGAWASCVGEAFLVGGTCRRSPCSHYYTRVSPPSGHPSSASRWPVNRYSRSELATTNTDQNDIAPAATLGLRKQAAAS